ncbi:hypothetical protein GCM10009415_50160 [Chitinophaga japonensis]
MLQRQKMEHWKRRSWIDLIAWAKMGSLREQRYVHFKGNTIYSNNPAIITAKRLAAIRPGIEAGTTTDWAVLFKAVLIFWPGNGGGAGKKYYSASFLRFSRAERQST